MTVESDGVITEVSREYEPNSIGIGAMTGATARIIETPALVDVTQAVAFAAAYTHRITPRTGESTIIEKESD